MKKIVLFSLLVFGCEKKSQFVPTPAPTEEVKPVQVHVRCNVDVSAEDCKKNAESVCPKFKELSIKDEPETKTRIFILECEK